MANGPLMFWLYRIFSLQGVSNLIRVIGIVGAPLSPCGRGRQGSLFIGSIGAVIAFMPLTVSFLFSKTGAFQFSHGFPLLGNAGQFLIKDLVLLGASIWTAAKARRVS